MVWVVLYSSMLSLCLDNKHHQTIMGDKKGLIMEDKEEIEVIGQITKGDVQII